MSHRHRTVPRSLARHAQPAPPSYPQRLRNAPSLGPVSHRIHATPTALNPGPGSFGTPATYLASPSSAEHPTQSNPAVEPTDVRQAAERDPANGAVPSSALSGTCRPESVFSSAPLSCVRWLSVDSSDAYAAVGSSDGGAAVDIITVYAVRADEGDLSARVVRTYPHGGRVSALCASDDFTGSASGGGAGTLFSASSDGGVLCLPTVDWDEPLQTVASLPRTAHGREPAVGVCPLAARGVAAVGAHGTLLTADAEAGTSVVVAHGADAVGFRAASPVDPDGGREVVTAGASGLCCVWDVRMAQKRMAPSVRLRHPCGTSAPMAVTVDASQPHFVLAGTSDGELVAWDRRQGDSFPLNRVKIHDGFVWDVRVVSSSRAGVLLSCGEDGRVWLMDFAAATSRGTMNSTGNSWRDTGEFWRAQLTENDVRNVAASVGPTLAVNSVDAHPQADLFAYVSDSAVATFGTLYS